MERYLHITKAPSSKKKPDEKKMSTREHVMHVATTPSTRGHDIWQSASTGHQVAEAGGKSVSYNDARLAKLQAQFPPAKPTLKRKRVGAAEEGLEAPKETSEAERPESRDSEHISLFHYDASQNTYHPTPVSPSLTSINHQPSGIFNGCVFYLNGYMGPKMSDHTLRRTLTQNGGTLSLYLKKTRITHVLLSSHGALANSKIRKEVEGMRNRVKFVKVDWVYKCLEVGKRIGEWEFAVDRLNGHNKSVASLFTHTKSEGEPQNKNEVPDTYSRTEKDKLDLLDAEEGERLDGFDR